MKRLNQWLSWLLRILKGNVYHKILKHHLVADKTLGTSDLETRALSGDRGLTLVEMAPFGIIGAITPSTNPSCTVICNSICMLAGGNGVIFNPHPHAKRISAYAVDLVNRSYSCGRRSGKYRMYSKGTDKRNFC